MKLIKLETQRMSIRQQLMRLQMTLTVALLIGCSLAFTLFDIYRLLTGFERNTHQYSRLISESVMPSLVFQDKKSGLLTLQNLSKDPTFVAARVVREDSSVFIQIGDTATLRGAHEGFQFADFKLHGFFVYSLPLLQDGSEIGQIITVYNTSELGATIFNHVSIVIVVLFVGLIASYFPAHYMQKTLAEPIVRLQKTMQTIAESGQYDLRVGDHITVDSNIETSQMANAFDKMLHQIEAHDRLIRDANENLESKIAERTRELLEAQKALVHSAKMSALGELSAGIAHEINNPLAIITGRCAIALRRLDQVSAAQNTSDFQKLHSEIVTDLNKINATALRINKTIRGLRSFARDGQYDPFESQSCNSLIQDAVELCGEKIRSHNIQLRVSELPEDVKIECRGTQITQVLVNLANNARDAIENTLNPWISIEAIVDDSTVRFQVTDSGLGLSPQVIDKLMTPFFTTKSVGKGTGLGLSISRGIAESHRGRLFVDTSPECKNTRFVLEIPLRQPIESAAA